MMFTINFRSDSLPFVVNCTHKRNVTMYARVKMTFNIAKEIPLENVIWIRDTLFTESNIVFYVLTILWHILPAMLMDTILKFCGSKSM